MVDPSNAPVPAPWIPGAGRTRAALAPSVDFTEVGGPELIKGPKLIVVKDMCTVAPVIALTAAALPSPSS